MKPQPSPDSSIWPRIGTKSSGWIRSVSSHIFSMELTQTCPRSRLAAELKSPAMMSASFSSATFLSWLSSCFATSRLFAHVCGDGCVRAIPLLRRRTYCSVVVVRLHLLDQTQQPPSLSYPGRQFAPPSRHTPPVKCVSHTSWRQRPTHIVRKPNPTRSPGNTSVTRTAGAPADMSHRKT